MCITCLNRLVTLGLVESQFMFTGSATVKDDLPLPVVEFARILVATDFSEGARAALECALAMGRRLKSKVFLLHAILWETFTIDFAKFCCVRLGE